MQVKEKKWLKNLCFVCWWQRKEERKFKWAWKEVGVSGWGRRWSGTAGWGDWECVEGKVVPHTHPHSQTAVCLAQLELNSDHWTTLHYIPMGEVSVSCTLRWFRNCKLRGSDWVVGGSGAWDNDFLLVFHLFNQDLSVSHLTTQSMPASYFLPCKLSKGQKKNSPFRSSCGGKRTLKLRSLLDWDPL